MFGLGNNSSIVDYNYKYFADLEQSLTTLKRQVEAREPIGP